MIKVFTEIFPIIMEIYIDEIDLYNDVYDLVNDMFMKASKYIETELYPDINIGYEDDEMWYDDYREEVIEIYTHKIIFNV